MAALITIHDSGHLKKVLLTSAVYLQESKMNREW